jgi:hypothetical protein
MRSVQPKEEWQDGAPGGSGNRMHHKFVVIDFDKPTAHVYLGSYSFSATADKKNGKTCFSSATAGSRSPT